METLEEIITIQDLSFSGQQVFYVTEFFVKYLY